MTRVNQSPSILKMSDRNLCYLDDEAEFNFFLITHALEFFRKLNLADGTLSLGAFVPILN